MCVSDSTGYHSTLTASASPRHAILNGKDSFLASRQSAFMAPDDGFKSFLAVKCERLTISHPLADSSGQISVEGFAKLIGSPAVACSR